ncbi:hypothetical protein ACFOE1_14340 [Agromyces mediolanus]|uniref:Integral membrane protein n=1 Tax=Agromyces mediolanus TaxID=41986 RepID=A0A918CFJ7_AGRME|nr:hypothetical protein [Agromyces mediolanus]GGR21409.1 hypothetical protein GCM10010196_13560 [Agromyces mediolanus]GLJ73801.1 hypothetical protein GCM10017583_30600 [Agromyces mediolanus]
MLAPVLTAAALGLTAASGACAGLAVVRRAAPKRVVPAAIAMAVSAVDMLLPGTLLAPVAWGALLLLLALGLLLGRTAATARAELAWHAGSTLVMAAMWFGMAMPAAAAVTEPAVTAPGGAAHGGHGGPVLGVLLLVAALALAVAAFRHLPRARRQEPGIAAWRHPLMAVAMLAMLAAMPAW